MGTPADRQVFPQLFQVLPNECFYNSIEIQRTCFLFLLENSVKPAGCFVSSHDKSMLRFGGYLLRFHLASDWSRNNKHSRNFSGVHGFQGKTVKIKIKNRYR